MKHLFYFIALVSAVCLAACSSDDDNNDGAIEAVTDATATPFIGSVKLKFKVPTSANFYYTLITYKDSEGNVKHYKAGPDEIDSLSGYCQTTIGGFTDTENHDFVLQAATPHGNLSQAVTVSATPMSSKEAKNYVLGTVTVTAKDESALLTWTNESGIGVTITASYPDIDGNTVTEKIDATNSGQATLTNLKPNEATNISVKAQNKDDQSETEAKVFTVTATQNVDDTINPDIDYFTLNTGGVNQEEISQPNKHNPYEYEIRTTGGDPFCPTFGLKKPKAGTVFKMRYKATKDFVMEFFWCDAGGGAAGGRSTTVEVKAADKWTTFTHDYGAAMQQHHWAGKTGDFIRMDMGNFADNVINVRNMHWE